MGRGCRYHETVTIKRSNRISAQRTQTKKWVPGGEVQRQQGVSAVVGTLKTLQNSEAYQALQTLANADALAMQTSKDHVPPFKTERQCFK